MPKAKRRAKKTAAKKKTATKKGHVPVKVLNKRLVRLNSLLTHRAGGKSYSGSPS